MPTQAPWSPEIVAELNRTQHAGEVHPYTCGRDRTDDAHRVHAKKYGHHDFGILTATPDGWICDVCGYTQDVVWR